MNELLNRRPILSLLTGAGLQIAAYAVGIALGLVLTPYLVRTLGDRQYAIFLFAGIFANWCGLVDFGMTLTAGRFITIDHTRRDVRGLNETASTAMAVFATLGLLAFAVAVLTALTAKIGWAGVSDINLIATVFLIAGAAFAVSKLSDGCAGIVTGVLRQDLFGATALFFRLATGLMMFAVLYFGGRVTALVIGSLVIGILNLLTLAFLAHRACPSLRLSFSRIRRAKIRTLCGYSVWNFVNQTGDLLIGRSDLIVIASLLSLVDMAHYNLAVVTLISYYGSFMQAMTLWQMNWFAHLFSQNDDALFRYSRIFSRKIMTWIAVFMSFSLVFFGKAFLIRWIGPTYLDAFPALILVAGSMAFYRGAGEVNIRVLQAVARHRRLALFIVLQGVMSVALSILFVACHGGLFGAALGTVLPALVVHGLIVPLDVCRVFQDSPIRYFGRMLRDLAAASAALITPYLLVRTFLTPDYPALLWVGATSAILYAATLWFFALRGQERAMILNLIRRAPSGASQENQKRGA